MTCPVCGGNKSTIIQELRLALEESVKLQSHYASLLNMYDGGTRLQFKTVDDWLKRLQYESYRTSLG